MLLFNITPCTKISIELNNFDIELYSIISGNGIIFWNSYMPLNRFHEALYKVGSDVILHNIGDINLNFDENYKSIRQEIKKSKKGKSSILPFNFNTEEINENTWYIEDLSPKELFREKIDPKLISVSSLTSNKTNIYNEMLISTHLFKILLDLKDKKYNNICVKMPNITNNACYDFVRLIHFCFGKTWIFKPDDNDFRDTWFVLALNFDSQNYDKIYRALTSVKDFKLKLGKILKKEIEYTELAKAFTEFSIKVCYIVNENISKISKTVI